MLYKSNSGIGSCGLCYTTLNDEEPEEKAKTAPQEVIQPGNTKEMATESLQTVTQIDDTKVKANHSAQTSRRTSWLQQITSIQEAQIYKRRTSNKNNQQNRNISHMHKNRDRRRHHNRKGETPQDKNNALYIRLKFNHGWNKTVERGGMLFKSANLRLNIGLIPSYYVTTELPQPQ